MPVEIRQEGRRLLVGVIRGVLRKSKRDALQTAAAALLGREETISGLIVLDGVEGSAEKGNTTLTRSNRKEPRS
jgi:hypothetical protein